MLKIKKAPMADLKKLRNSHKDQKKERFVSPRVLTNQSPKPTQQEASVGITKKALQNTSGDLLMVSPKGAKAEVSPK